MQTPDFTTIPLDTTSKAALASGGFAYRVVEAGGEDFDGFVQAVGRGFLVAEATDDEIAEARRGLEHRRLIGIYDEAGSDPKMPVATVDSWVAQLGVPGDTRMPMWAISAVTVAATHRRRGIARAMLEGELRSAAAAGVAVAGITVSEATIYGRFGFAPATFAADWTIDTSRAKWVGPRPDGRVEYISREHLARSLPHVHEQARGNGEVDGWEGLWREMSGLKPGDEIGRRLRAIQYIDAAGDLTGLAVYRIAEDDDDFTQSTLHLRYLVSSTVDAYAALWRFVVEHDLVSTIKAPLRRVDEPLRWMIADQRAARVAVTEHGWLRILDVPAALTARHYTQIAHLTLRVADDLGFADGTWTIHTDSTGRAQVTSTDDEPMITMSAGVLASLLLGGVSAHTLHAAGLIVGSPQHVVTLDSLMRAEEPYLSLWY